MAYPQGPLCLERTRLRTSSPLLAGDEFVESYRQEFSFRQVAHTCMQRLAALPPPPPPPQELPTSSVDSRLYHSVRLEAPYMVFTPSEFTLRYKFPPEELEASVVNMLNEDFAAEEVILVRGQTQPRRAVLYSEVGQALSDAVLKDYIRQGQPYDVCVHVLCARGAP